MIRLQFPDVMPVAVPDSIPTPREEISMLRSLPFDELLNRFVSSMVSFAINLLIAAIVFYVGRLIINKLYRLLSGVFIKRKLDHSLTTFVLSLVRIVLYFILIVTVIGILGIETSSFLALFASAGVAIGMALSGTLQNFAGGVLILLLKPYKIGDYIEAQGYAGTVSEIQIFHTIICTGDNKSIIIPNGGLSTGSVNNWSREDYRRIEWTVSISYGDSINAAREKILEIFASDPRIVTKFIEDDRKHRAEELASTTPAEDAEPEKPRGFFARLFGRRKLRPVVAPLPSEKAIIAVPVDRSPRVFVGELAASSVDLKCRAWVQTADYWSVFFDINERIYNELPEAGISFPFPQLDVHNIPNN
ncbi:MAG: mechanosensitive ion channel [Bacteroidales bacterium]|nr:mechanosensitive ion channel [Bacteroidales bacterium]